MKQALLIIAILLLAGCSIKHVPPTLEEQRVMEAQERSEMACYQAYAIKEKADADALNHSLELMSPERRMFVILMHEQQEGATRMMALATGRSLHACDTGETNFYDVSIAEIKAAVASNEAMLDTGKWAIGWGVGAWIAHDWVDSLADAGATYYTATDNAKMNVDSQNQGSQNIVSGDFENDGDNNLTNNNLDWIGDGDADGGGFDSRSSDPADGGGDEEEVSTDPVEEPCGPGSFTSNGTDWYTSGCSCQSHDDGQC